MADRVKARPPGRVHPDQPEAQWTTTRTKGKARASPTSRRSVSEADEADLYLEHNHVLLKQLTRNVSGPIPQDIEDAAAYAWIQFLRHQPDRDREWQGWLYRTAQHETWR